MMPERPAIERRLLAALDATPPRIPVVLGPCGSGRTTLLLRLRDQIGRSASQYIDLERAATTPERFLRAVTDASPFPPPGHLRAEDRTGSARDAFEATLAFLAEVRAPGGAPATFLLDELLELRTFESFPGLRGVLRELLDAISRSPNRFVLTTRYLTRAHRVLRDAPAQFEVVHVAPLTAPEVRAGLTAARGNAPRDPDGTAHAIQALTDGRPGYVRPVADTLAVMDQRGGGDPLSALAALLAPEGELWARCRYCYELRLHRARGYGALKAILDVLAGEEPLTLTEIAQRLHRTPGSTKDYLSWLEDVDLIAVHQKRYRFADPVLRLWVRLHCRTAPPAEEDVAREVQTYALARLPRLEPALAYAGQAAEDQRRSWGIIEID